MAPAFAIQVAASDNIVVTSPAFTVPVALWSYVWLPRTMTLGAMRVPVSGETRTSLPARCAVMITEPFASPPPPALMTEPAATETVPAFAVIEIACGGRR